MNTSHAGTYLLTYSVSDRFGNDAATKTRVVYVTPGSFRDRIPPVIFLTGADTITHNFGDLFIDPGVYALDNRDDSTSINERIEMSGKVDSTRPGIYQIIYKVEDSSENQAQKVRYVEVLEESQDRESDYYSDK